MAAPPSRRAAGAVRDSARQRRHQPPSVGRSAARSSSARRRPDRGRARTRSRHVDPQRRAAAAPSSASSAALPFERERGVQPPTMAATRLGRAAPSRRRGRAGRVATPAATPVGQFGGDGRPAARRPRRAPAPGPGTGRSSSPRTSAAWVDWVATSTEPPRSTASRAAATTAWLLPLPGGPETTTIGSVRVRRTTSRWAALSGNGDRGPRSSVRRRPTSEAAVQAVDGGQRGLVQPGAGPTRCSSVSRRSAEVHVADTNSAAAGVPDQFGRRAAWVLRRVCHATSGHRQAGGLGGGLIQAGVPGAASQAGRAEPGAASSARPVAVLDERGQLEVAGRHHPVPRRPRSMRTGWVSSGSRTLRGYPVDRRCRPARPSPGAGSAPRGAARPARPAGRRSGCGAAGPGRSARRTAARPGPRRAPARRWPGQSASAARNLARLHRVMIVPYRNPRRPGSAGLQPGPHLGGVGVVELVEDGSGVCARTPVRPRRHRPPVARRPGWV